jgi:NAD(P)-dependent dehydrogenase (short-subunit alcohol dehydrogenase family)
VLSPGHRIAGSVALVTGAGGGIGSWLVAELLRRGAARVDAAGRRLPAAAHPRVVPLALDITDAQQVAAAARAAEDVTLLVNNAGINHNQRLLAAPDLAAARAEMETNYFGTLAMCRAFAPVLAANGGGAIANVLSIAARAGMPAMGSLCASKAAALRMTECVRAELAAQGTLVVGFLPSAVDTAMTRGSAIPKSRPEDAAAALLDAIERGQEEVAFGAGAEHIARRLASDRAGLLRELARAVQP